MLLSVTALQTYIGQFHILQGINLEVNPSEIVVLLGRNGAGKTTTIRSIMGLAPPADGEILFGGESILKMKPYRVARKGIGFVPEDQSIFSFLTVRENLLVAARQRDKKVKERLNLVCELFPDLLDALNKKGGTLSGGQKQMLAIGRAFMSDNKLLLIDEPAKGLAPVVVSKLAAALIEIKRHTTVLLVEQNFSFASRIGDRFYIIDSGKIVQSGSMKTLIEDHTLQKRYLGISGEEVAH